MRLLRPLAGGDLPPARHVRVRALFLACLGVLHVAVFASHLAQVRGLVGAGGILPAHVFLENVREVYGSRAFWRWPTVLWWTGASDGALLALCWTGIACGALLVLGLVPKLACALAWVLFLSITSVGDVFLGYQWDALMLEATFLAALWAPLAWRTRDGRAPSAIVLWLLRWLLFRVVFLSGMVKYGGPTWMDLTALDYHYWTQPLPNALSHWAHHLPAWFQRASVVGMFAIEIGAPLLLFTTRRLRALGTLAIAGLMVTIAATGNYGFFEPTILVLCLVALDDHALRRLPRFPWNRRQASSEEAIARRAPTWRPWVEVPLAVPIVAATALVGALRVKWVAPEEVPEPVLAAYEKLLPLRSFNAYGVFARMTTERHEILVEGSDDGVEWKPYVFPYKPVHVDRRPRWTGPHMPRLDWQLWFAALRGARGAPWYTAFVRALLEGREAVTALLEHDPFPDAPPRWIRSRIAPYTFSSPAERARGVWWVRGTPRTYAPTVRLEGGRLVADR